MVYCAVAGCINNNNKKSKNNSTSYRYFRFPISVKEVCNLWVQKCDQKHSFQVKNARICSNHFTDDDYCEKEKLLQLPKNKWKLKQCAIPSLNLAKSDSINVKTPKQIFIVEQCIKKEEEEWDIISEDPLQLPENNICTVKAFEDQRVQEFAHNEGSDLKVDISESTLQWNEYNSVQRKLWPQHCINTEFNPQVEDLPTHSKNEGINGTSTFNNCRHKPINSFNSEKTVSNLGVSKLRQLLEGNKNTLQSNNIIKQKKEEFNPNSFRVEEYIKKEEEELGISEDSLKLPENNSCTVKAYEDQDFQEFSYDDGSDQKVDISETTLQWNECDSEIIKIESDSEIKRDQLKEKWKPKSNAQACRDYRQRQKLKKIQSQPKSTVERKQEEIGLQQKYIDHRDQLKQKQTLKSNAERCREYRQRQKMKKLKTIQSQQTGRLDPGSSHKNLSLKQIKEEVKKNIQKCNICSYSTKDKYVFRRHVNVVHNEKRITFSCQFCHKLFLVKETFDDHLLNMHKKDIKVKDLIKSEIYSCKMCPYETIRQSALKRHVNLVHYKQKIIIKCPFCDKLFTKKYMYLDHLLIKHSKEIKNNINDFVTSRIHTCEFCSYKTTRKARLNIHVNLAHSEGNITQHRVVKINCQFCNQLFSKKHIRDDHILKKHEKEVENNMKDFIRSTIHTCEMCPYKTTQKPLLNSHIKSMHSIPKIPVNCQFCDRSFATTYGLDYHLLKKHEKEIKNNIQYFITNRIHTCEVCSYKTIEKFRFKAHMDSVHSVLVV